MTPYKLLLTICLLSILQIGCEKNNCVTPSPIQPSEDSTQTLPPPSTPALKTSITTITPRTSGTNETLRDVFFVNNTTGFICGFNGTILKTTDGGITWIPMNSGVTQNLYKIEFADETIGYAVGDKETILKTTDGGITWVIQHYNPSTTNQHLRSLHVFDAANVYTAGHWGTFFTTNNGGAVWTDKNIDYSTTSYVIHFIDLNTGFVAGNFTRIRKTTNAGASFITADPAAIHSPSTSSSFAIIDKHFFDNQNGFIVAGDGVSYNSYLLKTSTNGEPWTIVYTSPFINSILYDIDFSSDSNGIMISKSSDEASTDRGKILKSTDGGTSWTIFPDAYNNLNRVFMINDTCAFMVGDDGIILQGE